MIKVSLLVLSDLGGSILEGGGSILEGGGSIDPPKFGGFDDF